MSPLRTSFVRLDEDTLLATLFTKSASWFPSIASASQPLRQHGDQKQCGEILLPELPSATFFTGAAGLLTGTRLCSSGHDEVCGFLVCKSRAGFALISSSLLEYQLQLYISILYRQRGCYILRQRYGDTTEMRHGEGCVLRLPLPLTSAPIEPYQACRYLIETHEWSELIEGVPGGLDYLGP